MTGNGQFGLLRGLTELNDDVDVASVGLGIGKCFVCGVNESLSDFGLSMGFRGVLEDIGGVDVVIRLTTLRGSSARFRLGVIERAV